MIIDDILNGFEKSDFRTELEKFCSKMKDQIEDVNERLENPEILYYNKFYEDKYHEKYLVLSMNPFDEEDYYIDIWTFNKTSEEYIRANSHKIKATTTKEVLVSYAKILKNLK